MRVIMLKEDFVNESDNVKRRFCKVHNYEIKGLVWKSDLGLPNRKLTSSLLKKMYTLHELLYECHERLY